MPMPHILVTRPRPQGELLCQLLSKAGFATTYFPSVVIHPAVNPDKVCAHLAEITKEVIAIFVSQHAVTHLFSACGDDEVLERLLNATVIAVGQTTADTLIAKGVDQVLVPKGVSNSEAVLALPALKEVKGRSVFVFRGCRGRELIHDELKARGAVVKMITTYERKLPDVKTELLEKSWRDTPFDLVVATSLSNLENLWAMLSQEGQKCLAHSRVTVMSEKMLTWAKAHGISQTIKIDSAQNRDLLNVIKEHVNG